jgi:5-methylcytosine-specific restriction endonuclease McrA
MTNWVRNVDGSIQSVQSYKRSQFEEFKKTHFRKWDSYKNKHVWIEVGSEQHKKILENKPTGKKVLSAPIEVPANIAWKWYQSEEWKKVRNDHINSVYKKNGIRRCNHCGAEGKKVNMHVDHIYPIRRYWSMRLDSNNLQDLCADCNKLKLNNMDYLVAERRLIKKDGQWVVLEVKQEPFVCPDWLKDKTPFNWKEEEVKPKTSKPEILSIQKQQ